MGVIYNPYHHIFPFSRPLCPNFSALTWSEPNDQLLIDESPWARRLFVLRRGKGEKEFSMGVPLASRT
jgi:hypothetical protein